MRAIDTNILIRFITADDLEQARRVRRLLEEGDLFVSLTVLMETEWVLRSTYKLQNREAVHALRQFVGLPSITVEEPQTVATALDRAEAGMDFADALHLGRADGCTAFVSFDAKLAKLAIRLSSTQVVEP